MPPLDQGFTCRVLKIEWKTSGIDHVCVCLAHSIQGCCETQPAWHWQRLRSQRPQWVCEKKVALLWRLAPKHIYLCTVAWAGKGAHTKASEEAASHGVERGGSEPKSVVSVWLGSAPFHGVFSPSMHPRRPLCLFLSITSDCRHSGKWNLLICESQHWLFKWGLEKKKWGAQAKREERIERGV